MLKAIKMQNDKVQIFLTILLKALLFALGYKVCFSDAMLAGILGVGVMLVVITTVLVNAVTEKNGIYYYGFFAIVAFFASLKATEGFGGLGFLLNFVFVPATSLLFFLRVKLEPLDAIAGAAIVSAVAVSLLLFLSEGEQGMKKQRESMGLSVLASMEKTRDQALKLYPERSSEIEKEHAEMVAKTDNVLTMALKMLPSAFFIFYALGIYLLYNLMVLAAAKSQLAGIKPLSMFQNWEFNWNFVWFVIVGMAVYLYASKTSPERDTHTGIAAMNMIAMGMIVFEVAGFSIVLYGLSKIIRHFFLRVAIVVAILPFAASIFPMVGIMDIWLNFRKPALPEPPLEDNSGNYPDNFYY